MFHSLFNPKVALALTLITEVVLGSISSNKTGAPEVTLSSSGMLTHTISVDTTLYGNQSVSETMEIAEGATLKLLGGNNYEFKSGLVIKGTLQVGNGSTGMEGLNFTVSGSKLDISGKLDIQNAADENAGLITLNPDYFINTGSIEISLADDNLGKTLFGPFINRGTVDLSGTNLYSSAAQRVTRRDGSSTELDGDIYLHGNSVYHVNGPLTGSGTIHLESYSILVLQETQSFNGPEISLEGGSLQVKLTDQGSTSAPITLKGYVGQNELTMENDVPFLMYDAESGVLTCDVDDVIVQFTIGTGFDSSGFYVSSGYIISYNYFDTANFVDYRSPIKSAIHSSSGASSGTSSSLIATPTTVPDSVTSNSSQEENTATSGPTGQPIVTSGPSIIPSSTTTSHTATEILTRTSDDQDESRYMSQSGRSSSDSLQYSISKAATQGNPTSSTNNTTTTTRDSARSTSSLVDILSTKLTTDFSKISITSSFGNHSFSSGTQTFISSTTASGKNSSLAPLIPSHTENTVSTAQSPESSFSSAQAPASPATQKNTGFYNSSPSSSSISSTINYESSSAVFSDVNSLITGDSSSNAAATGSYITKFSTATDSSITKVITITSCSANKCIEKTTTTTQTIASEANAIYNDVTTEYTTTCPETDTAATALSSLSTVTITSDGVTTEYTTICPESEGFTSSAIFDKSTRTSDNGPAGTSSEGIASMTSNAGPATTAIEPVTAESGQTCETCRDTTSYSALTSSTTTLVLSSSESNRFSTGPSEADSASGPTSAERSLTKSESTTSGNISQPSVTRESLTTSVLPFSGTSASGTKEISTTSIETYPSSTSESVSSIAISTYAGVGVRSFYVNAMAFIAALPLALV